MLKWKSVLFATMVAASLVACDKNNLDVRTYEVDKPQVKKVSGEAGSSAAGLAWDLPKDWKLAGQSSGMRLASFVTAQGGDVSVVSLGGSAGGETSNVNRWRNQLGLPPMNDSAVQTLAIKTKGQLAPFKWYKLIGKSESIYAALFELPQRTLFVKIRGAKEKLKGDEKAFVEFAKSIRMVGETGSSEESY